MKDQNISHGAGNYRPADPGFMVRGHLGWRKGEDPPVAWSIKAGLLTWIMETATRWTFCNMAGGIPSSVPFSAATACESSQPYPDLPVARKFDELRRG
jgi:hypothetical protein